MFRLWYIIAIVLAVVSCGKKQIRFAAPAEGTRVSSATPTNISIQTDDPSDTDVQIALGGVLPPCWQFVPQGPYAYITFQPGNPQQSQQCYSYGGTGTAPYTVVLTLRKGEELMDVRTVIIDAPIQQTIAPR
ncbi:MAG: hypothetical protein HY537_18510 [Deltaproteobacteria bacterium]|nr:hypothetical protein [Deltaproteobacteria bacterium]